MLGPVAQVYNLRTVILCKHATKNTGREVLRSQRPRWSLEKKSGRARSARPEKLCTETGSLKAFTDPYSLNREQPGDPAAQVPRQVLVLVLVLQVEARSPERGSLLLEPVAPALEEPGLSD